MIYVNNESDKVKKRKVKKNNLHLLPRKRFNQFTPPRAETPPLVLYSTENIDRIQQLQI